MATKKTTSATKKTETVKAAATKTTAATKAAATKAATKAITKASESAKTIEKKASEKKEAAKKVVAKKAPAKKKDIKVKTFIEYYGKQVEEKDVIASVKKAWTKKGKKVGDIKTMELYVKPEEAAVYYVINGTESGAVAF